MPKAMMLALNRAEIANLLDGSDAGVVASAFRLPTAPDFEPSARQWPYDPAGARALLADAGDSVPLEMKLVDKQQRSGKPLDYQRLIARQLEAGGFKVTWDLYRGTAPAHVTSEAHGGVRLVTRSTSSLRRIFNRRSVGGGWDSKPDGVSDAAIIKDLDRHVLTLFDERREVISRRLQIACAERLPTLPLTFMHFRGGMTAKLKGVRPPADDPVVFWNVEDWYLEE